MSILLCIFQHYASIIENFFMTTAQSK